MADERLTDRTTLSELADGDLIHVVDVSDTTDNPLGTSKKGLWSLFKSTLKTYFDTLYATIGTVSGTTNYISKFTGSNSIGNSQIYDNGTNVGIGTELPSVELDVVGSGKFSNNLTIGSIDNATTDTDKFIVSDDGLIKYRTGTQLLSDLGVSGIYVPYTGATGNVDLGTHKLLAEDLDINHTSGSGDAATITKGGNGEALKVVKTSGSGNAMSVTGGLTSLVDLSLSTVANATGDFLTHSGSTINKRTPAQVLSDIGGQAALTNPITGTGTTNYVSKFTGSTSLGNSQIFDNGTNVGIGTTSPSFKLDVSGTARATSTMTATKLIPTGNVTAGNGMYLPTTNTVAFSTNGGERLRITAVGNVGIGTTTPQTGLHLYDTVANATVGGEDKSILRLTNNYAGAFGSGGEIQFGLDVSAANRKALSAIKGTYSNFGASNYGGSLNFYTQNTDGLGLINRMSIKHDGNVGIGTTTPTYKLDVDGTGRFDDTVTAKDFIQDGDIAKTTISTAVTITDEQDLFYKVKTGRLIVQSFFEALTTASSQVIATLPIGARPETDRSFVVLNNNNSFGGVGTIQTNGNIIMNLTNGEVYILDFELTLDF